MQNGPLFKQFQSLKMVLMIKKLLKLKKIKTKCLFLTADSEIALKNHILLVQLISAYKKDKKYMLANQIQANSVITISTRPSIFVRNNHRALCSKLRVWNK
jgi:hypothetical protein